ncbi:MAG: hypothetical protein VX438_00550 [Planctomycetota bacterium]|nr:hypothetical protein [Planctomycetota bacterium]
MNVDQVLISFFAMVCLVQFGFLEQGFGQEKEGLTKTEQLSQVAQKLTQKKYLLEYKFKKGERVYWETEQVDSGEVSLQKKKEVTKSRTLSTKKWRIDEVLANGDFVVVQSIEQVDLWQQIDNNPPISYDSKIDTRPHPRFEDVADTVGIELVSFKAKKTGELVYKKANYSDVDLGVGGIIVQFPQTPVSIGAKWYQPSVIKTPLPTGQIKKIKIRRAFELLEVKFDVAVISVNTQILTPVRDPEVEVQIMHQITKGQIRFDIKTGRILTREFKWNRTAQGFSTADSLKKYIGRFKESMKSKQEIDLAASSAVKDSVQIKLIGAGPIFRD